MSYRCVPCGNKVDAGRPRLTHVVKRPDGNIEREVPVCPACQHRLRDGLTLAELTRIIRNERTKEERLQKIREGQAAVTIPSLATGPTSKPKRLF